MARKACSKGKSKGKRKLTPLILAIMLLSVTTCSQKMTKYYSKHETCDDSVYDCRELPK